MALSHSPSIVTNGLTFYYDMGNTQKSWKGAPTTNLITNPDWQLGTDNNFTGWFRSDTTNINVVRSKYLGEDCIKLTRNSGDTGYDGIRTTSGLSLSTSTTYTETIVYAVPYNMSQGLRFYMPERTNGVVTDYRHYLTALNATSGWQTFKYTFTTSATATSWDGVSIDWNTTTSTQLETVFIKSIQLEQGSFATPFVNGTRSNTQAILDLTNRNTLTTENLVYSSNNNFSFNGTDSRVTTTLSAYSANATWEAWVNCSESLNAFNMFMGYWPPYFSFPDGNRILFSHNISGTQRSISSPANLSLNTWYHATFTCLYDGTNTTLKVYVNGVEVGSRTDLGSPGNPNAAGFTVGDGRAQTPLWYPFKGQVDSIKVYNRTLSANEIQQNFNALRGRYGI